MSDELPQGWTTARISELCDVPKEKGREGVVPYLEIGNVNIGSKNYTLTDKPSVKGCRVAKKNDVLVSKVRPTRGAIIQIREDKIQVSSALTVLRNKGALAEKCLWQFLAWNRAYLNYLGENCTDTMYPTTSDEVITDFEMPIAPLAEQRRIVAKLEKLLGQMDACQQRLEKMPTLLKRFRQSILAAACSGRLTADWREEHDLDYVTGRVWVTDNAISLQGKKELVPAFYAYFLRSLNLNTMSAGTGQPYVSQEILGPIETPVVSLAEQQEIMRRVAGLFALADQLGSGWRRRASRWTN